ncbi:hypothetical protein CcCBS67573_g05127 [Chytriomyces confervae]|uniref:C2H2-type domain-containing protein n=1 Tax=Chytriomyces confervae TaxID=246404 RepID=A0A507FBF9_9FUNG|nr:hypothetical protein CcCBS67573_g05127 [Chytriomyces confervae]
MGIPLPRNSSIVLDMDSGSETDPHPLDQLVHTLSTLTPSPHDAKETPVIANSNTAPPTPSTYSVQSFSSPSANPFSNSKRALLTCDFPGCSKTFTYPSQQRSHALVHSLDRPFECLHEGCSAKYTTKNRLKIHQRSHSGEKPYVCRHEGSLPGFSAVQKCTLDAHEILNHGSTEEKIALRRKKKVKNVLCEMCGKAFLSASSVEAHYWQFHGNRLAGRTS